MEYRIYLREVPDKGISFILPKKIIKSFEYKTNVAEKDKDTNINYKKTLEIEVDGMTFVIDRDEDCSYSCPDISYSIGGRFTELTCLECGLMKEYCFVEARKLYKIKSSMSWSGVDGKSYPISIALYDSQPYYYCDPQDGDILLSSENCELIEKAKEEKYSSININNNNISYEININDMSITRSEVHLTYPLMLYDYDDFQVDFANGIPAQSTVASAVNFMKITNDNVKEKFLEEYTRLMDDYESKNKETENIQNNYKQQNVDIRRLKNDVAQLKNQLHFSISLITPCYVTSSLYIQHYFSSTEVKNEVYKYQDKILECQYNYIKMIDEVSECENDINKELGVVDAPINTNHEDKKAKIDRVFNIINPKSEPPPPSTKKEIKDITPENRMQIHHVDKGAVSSLSPSETAEFNKVSRRVYDINNQTNCPICQLDFELSDVLWKLNTCEHCYHEECLQNLLSYENQFKCPLCGIVFRTPHGSQPDGTMNVSFTNTHLPGYEKYGAIEISYYFPSGRNNDGINYSGTSRHAYLPDCPQGRKVLELLRKAFDYRLIFTIGTSVTTGATNTVVWAGIHHKTNVYGGPSSFGYPDDTYLDRVTDELKQKGVE